MLTSSSEIWDFMSSIIISVKPCNKDEWILHWQACQSIACDCTSTRPYMPVLI